MANDGKIRKDDLVEKGAVKVYEDLKNSAVSSIKAITQELAKLDKEQRKLGLSTKDIADVQKKQRIEINRLTIAAKKAAEAEKLLESAHKKVTKALKEETAAIRKDTAATKQSNSEKVKSGKANKTLAGTFKTLLKSMIAFIGVRMFIQAAKDVFELIKKLESLNFSLKAVTSNMAELIRTQAFLLSISFKYGANLVAVTERYTKFLAAAKQSNFALKDTERIFKVVTKAAGVLGLKTDELSGIYLALEQMMSKGKVTTEELRRQLGERLPGAFGIMAKALGVTTAQLDVMLKKGEILSSEALPKFAKALENIDYLKNVGKIETLIAEQTRMSNSWTILISNIEEGNGILSKTGKLFISLGTSIVSTMDDLSVGSDGFLDFFRNLADVSLGGAVGAMRVKTKSLLNKLKKDREKLEKELTEIIIEEDEKRGKAQTQTAWSLDEVNKLTTKQIKERINLYQKEKDEFIKKEDLINKLILKHPRLKQLDLEKNSYKELLLIEQEYFKKTIEGKRIDIELLRKSLEQLKDGEREEAKIIQKKIKRREDEIVAILGTKDKIKETADLSMKISQGELKARIEVNKKIIDSDTEVYANKVEALTQIQADENSIAKLILADKITAINKELISEESKNQKIILAQQELNAKIIEIDNKKVNDIQKLKDKEVSGVKELIDEEKRLLEIGFNEEMALLRQRNLSKEEFEKESKDITFKYKKLELEAIIRVTKAQIKSLEVLGVTGKKLEELKKQLEVLESIDLGESVGGDEGLSKLEKYQEALQALGSVLDSIAEIASNGHDANIIAFEKEMDLLEETYARRKELAGDDADTQKALDDELAANKKVIDKKIAKEKKAQFEANKLADLAQAGINIALAITKVLANPFQVALVSAAGALQLAAIASTPVPKFAEGGTMGYDGKMMINDHKSGRQEFIERNGSILTTSVKNAVVDGKKGDIIHKDYNSLMNASIMTSLANDNKSLDASKLNRIFDENYSNLESAITRGFKGVKNNIKISQQKVDIPHALYKKSQTEW